MKTAFLLISSILIINFISCKSLESKHKRKPHRKLYKVRITRNRSKKVYYPSNYRIKKPKKMHLGAKYFCIDLFAQKFAQGNAVYMEIVPLVNVKGSSDIKIKKIIFDKKSIPFKKCKWGTRALFGIHPYSKIGKKNLTVIYEIDSDTKEAKFKIKINKTKFHYSKKSLNLGKNSNVNQFKKPKVRAFIRRSWKKKKAAFKYSGRDMLDQISSHPRNEHKITSSFWTRRLYMRYKYRKGKKIRMKSRLSTHRGLDIRGEWGTPVFSIARGKVRLAEKLYYEGNMVIVDHGNRIFSYYMHMSKLTVKKGQKIKAGEQVGKVGSTGLSTGAHLHVSLLIKGVHVNPLSLLTLPIRN